jgi:hypothetical protein
MNTWGFLKNIELYRYRAIPGHSIVKLVKGKQNLHEIVTL